LYLRCAFAMASTLVLGSGCASSVSPAPGPASSDAATGSAPDGAPAVTAPDAPPTAVGAPPDSGQTSADAAGVAAPVPDASSTEEGDQPAPRPLMVDRAGAQLYSIKFKPSEADPTVTSNDAVQTALLDTRAPTIRAKLVVTLSGSNNPPGPLGLTSYAASQGFHALAVAYFNAYSPAGQTDPNFFGQVRFDEFDGMGRNTRFKVARPDSVEVRVTKALTFLQAKNPQGDWSYYLNGDGQVRWSDVIFFGQSHGATSAAAYAKLRRVWRAVSMSGPRDTNPVVATWLTMPSATPIDRFYGFTGTQDGQHPDHLKAMEAMGYLGAVVDVGQAKPPYGGSHRLQYVGGHTADLTCAPFVDPCQYMLGVLP
jgi:hypothetical protein